MHCARPLSAPRPFSTWLYPRQHVHPVGGRHPPWPTAAPGSAHPPACTCWPAPAGRLRPPAPAACLCLHAAPGLHCTLQGDSCSHASAALPCAAAASQAHSTTRAGELQSHHVQELPGLGAAHRQVVGEQALKQLLGGPQVRCHAVRGTLPADILALPPGVLRTGLRGHAWRAAAMPAGLTSCRCARARVIGWRRPAGAVSRAWPQDTLGRAAALAARTESSAARRV